MRPLRLFWNLRFAAAVCLLVFYLGWSAAVVTKAPAHAAPGPPIAAPQEPQPEENLPAPETGTAAATRDLGFLTSYEFFLTAAVLGFGVLVLILQHFTLKSRENVTAEDVTRAYSVILLLVGSLIFVTAGYSAEQIAPALGLFGTIAGYILGKSAK